MEGEGGEEGGGAEPGWRREKAWPSGAARLRGEGGEEGGTRGGAMAASLLCAGRVVLLVSCVVDVDAKDEMDVAGGWLSETCPVTMSVRGGVIWWGGIHPTTTNPFRHLACITINDD